MCDAAHKMVEIKMQKKREQKKLNFNQNMHHAMFDCNARNICVDKTM